MRRTAATSFWARLRAWTGAPREAAVTVQGTAAPGAGRRVLPVAGESVSQLRIDFAVTFLIGESVVLTIEEPFTLTTATGSTVLVTPDDGGEQLAPVLPLFNAVITQGVAFDDGRLEIEFDNGARIEVPAGGQFEAWQFCGPDGLLIVSMPTGKLGVWGP